MRVAAIHDYMDLKRELSHISRVSSVKHESKLEEGNVEDEVFNLDDFLRGMDRDAQTIGAKPKHLGLIWKNLVVEVRVTHTSVRCSRKLKKK